MPLNERGRTFESGKALSNDLRRRIIDEVVLNVDLCKPLYINNYLVSVAEF